MAARPKRQATKAAPLQDLPTETVQIAAISIPPRLRNVDPSVVEALAENIAAHGLFQPIVVRKPKGRGPVGKAIAANTVILVAGAHRLAAVASLGSETITAKVVDCTEAEARLIEIDENLFRAELSALERAKFLAARKEAYEALYPETRRGVAGGKARQGQQANQDSFAAATADRLRLSERTVQMWVALWNALDPEAAELLAPVSGLVTFTELRAFSHFPKDRQRALAKRAAKTPAGEPISLKPRDIARAVNNVQDEVFAKLAKAWARATPATRRRFLDHVESGEVG